MQGVLLAEMLYSEKIKNKKGKCNLFSPKCQENLRGCKCSVL